MFSMPGNISRLRRCLLAGLAGSTVFGTILELAFLAGRVWPPLFSVSFVSFYYVGSGPPIPYDYHPALTGLVSWMMASVLGLTTAIGTYLLLSRRQSTPRD